MIGHQPGHLAIFQQLIDAHSRFICVVLDHGQLAPSLADELAGQAEGRSGHAEAAKHD